MEFVIYQQNKTRKLEGAFEICATRENIEHLIKELQYALEDKSWFCGWHSVRPPYLGAGKLQEAEPWNKED